MFWKRALTVIAIAASITLGVAAVWMGALNQDEGWYLYAANLVGEGKVLYRDFFYTQGPLMPIVYSFFTGIWQAHGLLGARILTLTIGLVGIGFACALAGRLAPEGRCGAAALMTFLLLGTNLYHLYYLAIPKTYALAGTLVMTGFLLLTTGGKLRIAATVGAGLALAFAAGARISLGALLGVAGIALLMRREWTRAAAFAVGGMIGLGVVYGPFLVDAEALKGLLAAQTYHASRGGFDIAWTIGSFSRLVRWYLPIWVLLAFGWFGGGRTVAKGSLLLVAFLVVFVVQMVAPFPYEDYQVPVMALLAVYAAVRLPEFGISENGRIVLVMALAFSCTFGSPLLEKWATNGQDRFWSLKKQDFELPQLRKTAERIEAMDPGGKTLLTQDTYLAIETRRKVPRGLEMGPFSMMTKAEWMKLLNAAECPIAALSGYTFAVEPPSCRERPIEEQMELWRALKTRYECVGREDMFGQNSTPLLILKRK